MSLLLNLKKVLNGYILPSSAIDKINLIWSLSNRNKICKSATGRYRALEWITLGNKRWLGKAMERKFMQSVQTIRGMKIGTIWRWGRLVKSNYAIRTVVPSDPLPSPAVHQNTSFTLDTAHDTKITWTIQQSDIRVLLRQLIYLRCPPPRGSQWVVVVGGCPLQSPTIGNLWPPY